MRLYKVKIQFISFEKDLLHYPTNWMMWVYVEYLKYKLRRKFKKLNWTEDCVWDQTRYAESLKDAIWILSLILTKDDRLIPTAEKLIEDGYERGWK